MIFEPGDVVLCIDNSYSSGLLRAGEKYIVLNRSVRMSQLLELVNVRMSWLPRRFRKL